MSSSGLVVPREVGVPPQLVQFKAPRLAYTVLNSRKKVVECMFNGTKLIIPPVHETDAVHGETDAGGQLIPGTYVIEDIYTPIPEISDEVKTFDSTKAVLHVLGLQPGPDGFASIATSAFAVRGLSLLPRHPPREMWMAVAKEGEHRAFLADVQRAFDYMDEIQEKNKARKRDGLDVVSPGGYEYMRMKHLIDTYNDLVKNEAALELAPHQEEALAQDLEVEILAKAIAQKAIDNAGVDDTVDKVRLLKDLLNNPKVRLLAQKEYQIRKRGSAPVPDKKLADSIADGLDTVADIEP